MPDRAIEVSRAEELLSVAEAGIRDLIQQCLQREQYLTVSLLAEVADGVARVRLQAASLGAGASAPDAPEARRELGVGKRSTVPKSPLDQPAKLRARIELRYPHFEREGDRLVKVGWSKKDGREYEHKAPRAAVDAVCRALAKRGKGSAVWTMDTLLPVTETEGQEVPSYQVYLVVAWLRQRGVVERTGKDGYLANATQLTVENVEAAWVGLPKYEAKA